MSFNSELTGTSYDSTPMRLEAPALGALISLLTTQGYAVVGPNRQDGAIVYGPLRSIDDLPRGWGDDQTPGQYRLRQRDDGAYFGYAVGPHSWKSFLFPADLRLWQAQRSGTSFQVTPEEDDQRRYAFLGVRGCEIHALAAQDKVFMEGPHVDDCYQRLRTRSLVIAVECGTAASTCFCTSMGTGPGVDHGYDLALTEVLDGDHYFIARPGSESGVELLRGLEATPADDVEQSAARRTVQQTAASMGRRMDTTGIKDLLYRNQEHPRWDDVANRCLTCANCTLVCPTCFCSTVEDTNDLTGDHAERWRRWDSCFTQDYSYIHGGSVRPSARSRYRQWLTHKLASWIDQFGSSGCVGCGRCLTWCPVGIDITEEVAAIRASDGAQRPASS